MTLKPLRSCVGIYQNAYYQKEITCCNFSREGLSHWRKAHQISHEKVEEQLERLPDLKKWFVNIPVNFDWLGDQSCFDCPYSPKSANCPHSGQFALLGF